MSTIPVTKSRADELGLKVDDMTKRLDKNQKTLFEPVARLAATAVEGHIMHYGVTFATGIELGLFLAQNTQFILAALQEQGYLAKALPRQKKEKEIPVGHYL